MAAFPSTLPLSRIAHPHHYRWLLTRLAWLGLWLGWACLASSLSGCRGVNSWVMNSSGKAYFSRGNYTAARYDFERALMDRPYNANFAHNTAKAMHRQGNLAEAEQMYQHALTLNPNHAPSYLGLSDLLSSQGRMGEAQQMMQVWVEAMPQSPEAYAGLAQVQRKSGDVMGAEQTLQRAMQLNPRKPVVLNELAEVYQQSGRSQEAAQLYQRSLAVRPVQQEATSNLMAIRRGQHPSGALEMARTMPMNDPTLQAGGQVFVGGSTVMPAGGFMDQSVMTGPAMNGTIINDPNMMYSTPGAGVPQGGIITDGPALPGMNYSAPATAPALPVAPTNGAPPLPPIQSPVPSPYTPTPSALAPGAPIQLGQPVPVTSMAPVTTTPQLTPIPQAADPVMIGSAVTTPAF
jgi:Flp pilus assembly protein TadD